MAHFRTFLFLLFNVILLFPIPTHQMETTLVAPISKDRSTNLFVLSVYLNIPLRQTKLYLDLGFLFPWAVCPYNYESSSYKHYPCDNSLCKNLGFGGLACQVCPVSPPPHPNCKPHLDHFCSAFPENPVTGLRSGGVILRDTLALRTTNTILSVFHITDFNFSCSQSTLFINHPENVKGLAALGRSNVSIPAQISAALNTPNIFALCFPNSHEKPGVAFFGSAGPYYAVRPTFKIDLSIFLVYTRLIVNPVALGDTEIDYPDGTPSSYYYIDLTSIQIDGNPVPINSSLLTINQETGFGGTKLSTATPYTLLESSIFKAFTELFVKQAYSSTFDYLTPVTDPPKPFSVCYAAENIIVTALGPVVPNVELVLHERDVVWRIYGANSMVKVAQNTYEWWCLGFVDGGVNIKTPIVIGGKQLEDNLLQFDLRFNSLGFTSSLLPRSLTCADAAIDDNPFLK